jgi:hypothetical protein
MSPFYRRLPTVPPFANDVTADQIGLGLIAGVTALTGLHAAGSYVRKRRMDTEARAELAAVSAPLPAPRHAPTSPAIAEDEPRTEGRTDQ